jgi:ATP-binding cassette subfamily B (MDR/TAP) protein 7
MLPVPVRLLSIKQLNKQQVRTVYSKDLLMVKSLSKYMFNQNKIRVAGAMSLLFAGKMLNVSVPFIFKHAVDALSPAADLNLVSGAGTLLIGYGCARLGAIVFQELRNAVFGKVSQSAIRNAALGSFNHLLRMDSSFHLTNQTGALVRAIDRGTKGISQILQAVLFHIFPTALEISIVCSILIYTFGVEYALVTLLTMASYAIFTLRTTAWRIKIRKAMNEADNKAAATATDSLLNFEAVQLFNNESYQSKIYDLYLSQYEKAAIKTSTSLALLNAGQGAIFSVALSAMMYMASQKIAQGALTIGDLVMINGLVFQLSLPLNFLGSVYRELRQSLTDMSYMFRLEHIPNKLQSTVHLPQLQVSQGSIRFDQVSFSYQDRKLIDNLTLNIKGGTSVAFVGHSGSGKSTLLKLVTGFISPDQGAILIDEQDLAKVQLESIRRNIGVVSQDTILFNQSIYENIKYGNVQATREQVHEASKHAYLHNVIEKLPQKYETMVGERGLMISGGEKQRVQLARVFLKVSAFYSESKDSLF